MRVIKGLYNRPLITLIAIYIDIADGVETMTETKTETHEVTHLFVMFDDSEKYTQADNKKNQSGKIFNKLEKFIGFKYPVFIKNILIKTGFDCESAIETLNENSITEIEKLVTPDLIKNTVYEQSETLGETPFKFLIGHKALILNIPVILKQFIDTKLNIKTEKENQNKDKLRAQLNPVELKNSLIHKINISLKKKNINLVYSIEHINSSFDANPNINPNSSPNSSPNINTKNSVQFKVKCLSCNREIPCTFDKYWRVSNFLNHNVNHCSKGQNVVLSANQSQIEGYISGQRSQINRAKEGVLEKLQLVLEKKAKENS